MSDSTWFNHFVEVENEVEVEVKVKVNRTGCMVHVACCMMQGAFDNDHKN